MSSKKKKRKKQLEQNEKILSFNSSVLSSKREYLDQELSLQAKEFSRILRMYDINELKTNQKELFELLENYQRALEIEQSSDKDISVVLENQKVTSDLINRYFHERSITLTDATKIDRLALRIIEDRILNFQKLAQEKEELSDTIIENGVQLNEAKVLIVGQGEVGKTSLIKRMIEGTFDPLERKTEGISIKKWGLRVKNKDIRLNIWDFGGQEIMHATHQFFLTNRSLYLLVIADRKDEYQNNLEYWLKLIQSFGGDSPVIIVINKSENDSSLDLAERSLKSKYSNIKAFIKTSCETGLGIQNLKDAMITELSELKMVHDFVNQRWISIKNHLENMQEDYIDFEEYKKVCRSFGVEKPVDQRNLIRFLHDLGTVLNFGFNETTQRLDIRLENTNVINPEWVTKGVYAILNSSILNQGNGIIKLEQLGSILDTNKYPKDKQIYILEMMKKFELCFELDEERDKFLVVAGNLAKDEPDIRPWTEGRPLKFEFHYNFLPSSVISRFIVRMYQAKNKNLYWRTGIAIKDSKNEALIKADLSENKIYIYVTGNWRTRREFLAIVRSELIRINNTIAQLEAKEKIPYNSVLIDYDELIGYEEMGEVTIVLPALRKRVKVQEILEIVDPNTKTKKKNKAKTNMKKNNPWISGSFYLVAFVVVIVAIGLLAYYSSWIAVPVVLIASLLAISIIGALQLKNDDELKDESFLKLVIEFYKRLPLLKK